MDKVEVKANLFVDRLLTDGAKIPCDNTQKSFKKTTANEDDLPYFYDEELFKKGQQFYHRNVFALFSGTIFGLLSVLAIPTIAKVLIHTRQTRSDSGAYRRYAATVLHLTVWYDSDFKPGSKLWKSITQVKNLHNCASQSGCSAGLSRISQKDMALTQFGFMGYQLVRAADIGLQHATDEEWRALIHIWKVVGYLLGIEDRFNVCQGSVSETKAICEKLIRRAFIPEIQKKNPEFLELAHYFCNAMWVIQPLVNFNVLWFYLNCLLNDKFMASDENEDYKSLSLKEKVVLFLVYYLIYSLRFKPFRWLHNLSVYRDLWLVKNFQFLAWSQFGYKYTQVRI